MGKVIFPCKVHIFWEGHKIFAKSSPNFWLALHRTKVMWRFRKILWPSQNIWTLLKLLQQLDFFPTYQLYVVLSCKLYHHARPQNVTRYQEMNLSDLLILLSIIEFSSHIFAKLQLCIGYRITSTHSCAEDFTLEPETFCSHIYTDSLNT